MTVKPLFVILLYSDEELTFAMAVIDLISSLVPSFPENEVG